MSSKRKLDMDTANKSSSKRNINMAAGNAKLDDNDKPVDVVRGMIPPDVFLHHIVGPYLTPKENKLVVQRVWPTGFDYKTHCCPKHTGTVFTYFEDPPRFPPPAEENEDDDGNEGGNDDADEGQENQDAAAVEPAEAPAVEPAEAPAVAPMEEDTAKTLRCRDCVMEAFRNERRCDHCNVFQGAGRVSNKCRRCPQIFCDRCDRETYDGVCGDCTLCACCRDVVDFPEEACKTCSDIYCGNCHNVLSTGQEEVKENYRITTLAAIAEAKKQKLAAAAEARQKKQKAEQKEATTVLAALAFDDNGLPLANGNLPAPAPGMSTSQAGNNLAAGNNTDVDSVKAVEAGLSGGHGEDAIANGGEDNVNNEGSRETGQDTQPYGGTQPEAGNVNIAGEMPGAAADQEGPPESANNGGTQPEVEVDSNMEGNPGGDAGQEVNPEIVGEGEVNPGQDAEQEEGTEENGEGGGCDDDDNEQEPVIDYGVLNLPNLNKELQHVQVCRRCNICYCSRCTFQHQCTCCGCSYWM